MRRTISTIVMSLVTAHSALAADICTTTQTSDNLKWVQYYLSRPQDAPGCAMRVENGVLVPVPPVQRRPR